MPFTLLSHQSVVLPLKMRRPALFSGTALVFGSMAPDFEYFIRFYALGTVGHTLVGQFIFCLPLTLAVYWLVTRVIAVPLATHLPSAGRFRLREYRWLAAQPAGARYWLIVAISALVGSFSHVAFDALTHSDHFAGILPASANIAVPLSPPNRYWIVQYAMTFFGGLVTLWLLVRIGRDSLLERWANARGLAAPPALRRRPLAFWTALVPFPIAAVMTSILLMKDGWLWSERGAYISTFLRVCTFTFVGLCVVSLWARSWTMPDVTESDGVPLSDSEDERRAFVTDRR